MDLEAHAVPEPVAEPLAVTGRGDPLACERVDLRAGRPGPDLVEGRNLSLEHEVVHLRGVIRERTGRERPGAVRAVAVDHAPQVDDHQLTRADQTAVRLRVR